MSMRTILLATTALVLTGGSALAEQNFSNVVQDGSNNSGLVTQDGTANQVGTAGLAATQDGNANSLDFLQEGDGNEIGTGGAGFRQDSNRNTAEIGQSGAGNRVLEVQQTGIGSGAGGTALRRNTLVIEQGGTGSNTISRVTQTRLTGLFGAGNGQAGNLATLTQTGSGNVIGDTVVDADGLTQEGRRHVATVTQTGADNRTENLRQTGLGHQATVTQDGDGNVVVRIDQRNQIVLVENEAVLSFDGNANGAAGFSLTSRADGAWGSLSQGHVDQSGNNTLGFSVTGDDNRFGFDQDGGNDVSGVVDGARNQTGVQQLGLGNTADFDVTLDENDVFIDQSVGVYNVGNAALVTIVGSRNAVGLGQSLTGNAATVTISNGDDNTVNLLQESALLGNDATVTIAGSGNDVSGSQAGLAGTNTLGVSITGGGNDVLSNQTATVGLGGNDASVNILGDDNFLDLRQTLTGLGSGNSIAVSLSGSGNNRSGFAAGSTAALAAGGLTPGQIVQSGNGNAVDLAVGGVDPASDANLFAFSQTGDGNGIDGSIDGTGNQVAIVQAGDGNYASFTQVGNFNSIGIGQ